MRDLQKLGAGKRPGPLIATVCFKLVASEACRGICMHKNPIRVSVEREFFVLATTRKCLTRYSVQLVICRNRDLIRQTVSGFVLQSPMLNILR